MNRKTDLEKPRKNIMSCRNRW